MYRSLIVAVQHFLINISRARKRSHGRNTSQLCRRHNVLCSVFKLLDGQIIFVLKMEASFRGVGEKILSNKMARHARIRFRERVTALEKLIRM